MYNPRSLAVRSSEHFATLVQSVITRLHRKHDARFQLLDEALSVLEARSSAVFPTIRKCDVRFVQISGGPNWAATLTGLNLSGTVVATLGGVPLTLGAQSATSLQVGAAKAALSLVADTIQMLEISVDGVSCAPITMIVVA